MRHYHGRIKRNKAFKRLKQRQKQKDTSCIPTGDYCYKVIGRKSNGNLEINVCPYWEFREDIYEKFNFNEMMAGYCKYLELGDWNGTFLLWDQCKECNINLGDENES